MPLKLNSSKTYVNGYSAKKLQEQVKDYPQFFMGLKLSVFRHIRNLDLEFKHPITVISGTNRSGKTTALMAIACSHYNFKRPNVNNGRLERAMWSSLVRFTSQDMQGTAWAYQVRFRVGNQVHINSGSRNALSGKWSGVAKKSGQIGRPTVGQPMGGRTVVLIDLNRITPSRHLSKSYYNKVRRLPGTPFVLQEKVKEYLSFVLEDTYNIEKIASAGDSEIYKFTTTSQYSSFNTASGEDVLMCMICQILEAPENSLILIDEIEVGLHPRIQRRLMDVLYDISQKGHKQFIVTSHAYAILDSVPQEARIFIDHSVGVFRNLAGLTTYESLTRMDCESFPVSSVYVEDEVSKAIVKKAIAEITTFNPGFNRLINVIVVGAANQTFEYFKMRNQVKSEEPYTSLPACVLDGDMSENMDANGNLKYPPQDRLFFHNSIFSPEKMLLGEYLKIHPNATLQYHYKNSSPHCLFQKMVDVGIAIDKNNAFEQCFAEYHDSAGGSAHFEALKQFLM